MLQCHVKGCHSDNFPLALSDVVLNATDVEFELEFIKNIVPRLDYPALAATCLELGMQLPTAIPEDLNEEFLKGLGNILMQKDVMEGAMTCRGCGHVYLIKNGIPNMLLSETEV